jgi:hypothetical protein
MSIPNARRSAGGPDYADCMALAEYWSEQSRRPGINAETKAVCKAECDNWLAVCDQLVLLSQATPLELADEPRPQRRAYLHRGARQPQADDDFPR